MELSIIIPAFNEEKRILLTLDKSVEFLVQRPWSCELIVVDDGSSDQTVARVQEFASRLERGAGEQVEVRCLQNDRNRGKGFSIRHGVGESGGRYVGFMDADYKTDIAGLDAVFPLLEEGYDGVIGDRTHSQTRIAVKRRRFRQLGSELFSFLLRSFVGLGEFGDTQCGFKFFQGEIIRELFAHQRAPGFMFDVEILLLATRAGYRIAKVPVVWSDDPDSRFKPVSGSLKDLWELIRIRWWHRKYGSAD